MNKSSKEIFAKLEFYKKITTNFMHDIYMKKICDIMEYENQKNSRRINIVRKMR